MFEWFEDEVRGLEQKRASAPPHPVAFYGSSSIRLWDTLTQDFAESSVVNLGFGGSTLEACAFFFDRIVPPYEPRSLIVYAGDNDLGDGQSADAVLRSFDTLWGRFAAEWAAGQPDMPFAYLSIKPSPARWHLIDRIRAVNAGVQARLRDRPGTLYVDVFTPMLSDTGGARPELFTDDGLHMNRDGYRVWWQVLSAHRQQLRL